MKRAKGATLAEIMKATGWQVHTVRGFVSILVAKEARRSNRPRAPRASGRTRSQSSHDCEPNRSPLPVLPGRRFLLL